MANIQTSNPYEQDDEQYLDNEVEGICPNCDFDYCDCICVGEYDEPEIDDSFPVELEYNNDNLFESDSLELERMCDRLGGGR